jgi:hypothetical protein
MNLQIEINSIKKELDEIQDENLIKTIKSLLNFAKDKKYESGLKPMSITQYRARANASERDIKKGKLKDIEVIEKESDNW